MSSAYTLKHLTDIDDQAPKFGLGEIQEARFGFQALEAQDTGMAFHRLKPNKRAAFGHRHDKAEEIYVVIGGAGRVKLDDDILDVQRLDAIRVAPGVVRAFEAGDDGLDVLAFGPRHEGDGEIIRDWWTD